MLPRSCQPALIMINHTRVHRIFVHVIAKYFFSSFAACIFNCKNGVLPDIPKLLQIYFLKGLKDGGEVGVPRCT